MRTSKFASEIYWPSKTENEIDVLTSTLKIANAKEIQLQEELRDTREKVDELQEFKQQNILNLRDKQKKLDESKLQIERLEHIKGSFRSPSKAGQ